MESNKQNDPILVQDNTIDSTDQRETKEAPKEDTVQTQNKIEQSKKTESNNQLEAQEEAVENNGRLSSSSLHFNYKNNGCIKELRDRFEAFEQRNRDQIRNEILQEKSQFVQSPKSLTSSVNPYVISPSNLAQKYKTFRGQHFNTFLSESKQEPDLKFNTFNENFYTSDTKALQREIRKEKQKNEELHSLLDQKQLVVNELRKFNDELCIAYDDLKLTHSQTIQKLQSEETLFGQYLQQYNIEKDIQVGKLEDKIRKLELQLNTQKNNAEQINILQYQEFEEQIKTYQRSLEGSQKQIKILELQKNKYVQECQQLLLLSEELESNDNQLRNKCKELEEICKNTTQDMEILTNKYGKLKNKFIVQKSLQDKQIQDALAEQKKLLQKKMAFNQLDSDQNNLARLQHRNQLIEKLQYENMMLKKEVKVQDILGLDEFDDVHVRAKYLQKCAKFAENVIDMCYDCHPHGIIRDKSELNLAYTWKWLKTILNDYKLLAQSRSKDNSEIVQKLQKEKANLWRILEKVRKIMGQDNLNDLECFLDYELLNA